MNMKHKTHILTATLLLAGGLCLTLAAPSLFAADPPAPAAGVARDIAVRGAGFIRADGRLFVPRGLFMRGVNFADEAAFEKSWGLSPSAWLDKLAESGANTIRILPTLMVGGKEVVARPESDPAHAEQVTKGLEWLLSAAAKKGIQVVIVPTGISWDGGAPYYANKNRWTDFSFGEFKDWDSHPYNKKNGGPLDNPSDLLDTPAGKKLFADRIAFYLRFASHPNLIGLDLESRELDGWADLEEGAAGRDKRIQFFVEQIKVVRNAGLLGGLKMEFLHTEHTRRFTPPGSCDWQRYKHGDGWWQPWVLGTGKRVAGTGNSEFYAPMPAWTSRPQLNPLMTVEDARPAPLATDRNFRMHRALALLLAYTPEINPAGPGSVAEQFATLCTQLQSVRTVAARMEASTWTEPVETIAMFNSLGMQSGDGARTVAFVQNPVKGYKWEAGFEKSPGASGVQMLYLRGGAAHEVLVVSAATGKVIREETVPLGDIPFVATPDEPVLIFARAKEAGK
jgi:hypothetical protein